MIQLFFEKRKKDPLETYFNLVKKINQAESTFINLSDHALFEKNPFFQRNFV